VDDQRVIGGLVHVLRSGCPWPHAPREYGPPKTLCNRFARWAAKGLWERVFRALATAGGPPADLLLDCSLARAPHAPRAGEEGARAGHRADGESIAACRDGVMGGGPRSTLRHARPASRSHFVYPGDETADFHGGEALIDAVVEDALVIADRAFDAYCPLRRYRSPRRSAEHPAQDKPVAEGCLRSPPSPPPPPRRSRNAVERLLCRLKDFSRVAARYDRLAATCLASVRVRRSTEGHIPAFVAFRF
jgi:transposase